METLQNNTTVKRASSKRIRNALKNTDAFVCFFYLKRINLVCEMFLDNDTCLKLHTFIKNFISIDFPIRNDFSEHMNKLLKCIRTDSPEIHLKCVSLVHFKGQDSGSIRDMQADLEYYRGFFSYTKIYSAFKEHIKNILIEDPCPEYTEYLILLLNNSKLVYKHFSPIIQKISLFVDQHIVDKTIVECCAVLTAMVRNCPGHFPPVFLISILIYLVDILCDPQNFIFLDFTGYKIMTGTVETLARFVIDSEDVPDIDMKKTSLGILRKIVEKIKEFDNSSVYEETMVVLSATHCLEPAFRLYVRFHNRDISFIDSNLLSFTVFEKSSTKKETKGIPKTNSIKIDFERPFKHHYNAHYQILRDEFIVNKYRFLDLYWSLIDIDTNSKRIEFFNDLLKIEASHRLFAVLNNFKRSLDWSDLIVFACNAPCKISYIPALFDKTFLENPEHGVFLDLFLTKIKEAPRDLVYFTQYSVCTKNMNMLAKLYLIDPKKEDNISKKRREMILRLLWTLGDKQVADECTDSEVAVTKSKQVKVKTEKHPIEGDLIEKIKKIEIREITRESSEESVEKKEIVEIERLPRSEEINQFVIALSREIDELGGSMVPLLIVIASKRLEIEDLEKLLVKIYERLNASESFESYEIPIICTFSILCCVYRHNFFKNHKISSKKDLFICALYLKRGYLEKNDSEKLIAACFEELMNLDDEDLIEFRDIYRFEDSNHYVSEFRKIESILKEAND